jgi:hypothetical protein
MTGEIERFCSEKRLRFGYGSERGLEDFFDRDPNGVYLIVGRPVVGRVEGEVVLRGNAVQYRDELAERMNRNGRTATKISDNRLRLVFKIKRPVGGGGGFATQSGKFMYFEGGTGGATVYMTSNLDAAPDLQYSTDCFNWHDWPYEESGGTFVFDEIELAEGEKVYVRGTNERLSDNANSKYSIFAGTGSLKSGGTIQSLVSRYRQNDNAIEMARLFYQCTALESAPLLPATTLAPNCYRSMFYSCTSLASLPDGFTLPANTLAPNCYFAMFYSCTALASLPDGFTLPATTLTPNCYAAMFDSCTALASLPDGFTLPATTLASGCYYGMFHSCTALASLPDGFTLPATTLASDCYAAMFSSCPFQISDDGTTFNFTFGATLPQTVGGVTYATDKDVATWMGNTTGFNE